MILIPAGNPSQWTGPTGTNTYLLRGRVPAIIDAGVGNRTHVDAVESALEGRDLEVILLTHSHSDHSSGVPALLQRWPGAVVRPTTSPLHDGLKVDVGDSAVTALHTPGHSPDHFCFIDEDKREVFCGDLIRAGGTIVIPASRGGDLAAYISSLRRLRELRPKRLWPGHGPVIEKPDQLIAAYLAHREEREAQVIAALRRGRGTPAEIVEDVYPQLTPALLAAAAESVLAHLKKLADEGVAMTNEAGSWRLT